jgi:hypothetical protein
VSPAAAAATVGRLESLLVAGVLGAFLALALRTWLPLVRGPRSWPRAAGRAAGGLAFGVLAGLYALFTAPLQAWDAPAALAALAAGGAVLGGAALGRLARRTGALRGPLPALGSAVVVLALLLVGALTLMRAGFLALTEDRLVLLVELTGETRPEAVRWAPPNGPPREATLTAHRVMLRTAAGAPVAEGWVYGDQVAVKGRVLRVAPLLAAAGLPGLFELQFAHNGYATPERHAAYPHAATPLPRLGPLAVHPWWRPVQARLLAHWERGAPAGWGIRSVVTESTYFPLVDAQGQALRATYRLVVTPGGFSSS